MVGVPEPSGSAILWMIIPGQAQWLKEFFDIKMIVTNLAPAGFTFSGGKISLGDLPNGLSLAPTATPQALVKTVPDIASDSSASADWILRGDAEGFYAPTGTYTATLDPVGTALSLPIASPPGSIHVWGGSALRLIVNADDKATVGSPYIVDVGLENVADVPVYNPSISLLTQGRLNYIYQPDEQLTHTSAEIDPGQTFSATYRLISEITGNLDQSLSFVQDVAGNTKIPSQILSHPATLADSLTAANKSDGLHLTWQAPTVPGITGYDIFFTPTRNTLFGATPLLTVSASTHTKVIPHAVSGFYAVSTVVNGVPTLYNSLVAANTGVSAKCNPTVITSGSSGSSVVGKPFNFTVTTCAMTTPAIVGKGFPAGIKLVDNRNGTATISGTPTITDRGPYTATITASVKGKATITQHFVISVDDGPLFTSKAADTVKVGTAFTYSITTIDGYPVPSITTASTLPTGVVLIDKHNGSATLKGTPAAGSHGIYVIKLVATNGVGAPVKQTLTLTVN